MRQLRAVADISEVVEVPERTVLTRQGEAGDEFFIIIDGTALVTPRCTSAIASGPASSSAR